MNTTSRIGKIARLPHNLREQLNLKLHDGVPAKSILPWLNSLPEVKAVLATDFDNRPVSKQNLSEWKHGGFRDWLLQYQASQFLQFTDPYRRRGNETQTLSSEPLTAPDHPDDLTHDTSRITSRLLLWTQLQYTAMARFIDSETDPQRKWNSLRQFATDISRLRRSTLADDYLQIQRDWLSLSQSNTADKKEKEFWIWTKRPDIEKKLFPDRSRGMTAEELYQFEKDCCLLDGPAPEIAELMAEVRIAKKLLELRKATEAQAKAKSDPDYDPNRPLPDTKVRLAGMPFEELFPTLPETPLTETHPELDPEDPDRDKYQSHNNAGSAATAQVAREGQAQLGLPTAPLSATAPLNATNPSDSSDQPCLPGQSEPLASDPACHTEAPGEGGSNPVKPNPTKSNQIQPPSPQPDVTM